jgi:hypothetical protein
MVFVMKRIINYIFYVFTVTFLFSLMTTMNSQFVLVSLEPSYATPQLQEDSASENNDSSPAINGGSETTQENTGSEQSGRSNNEQNSINNDAINEEGPIQQPQQQQQSERLPQQNLDSNRGQNRFVSPRIDSDAFTSNLPNTEVTNAQKSFDPAGQFKPKSGQTESSIPLLSNNFSQPFTPGAGNAQVEGIGLAYLTVYPNFTYTEPVEICVFTSHPYEVKANPYCIEPYSDGTFHALQAPGLIGIRILGNAEPVDTSNCEFHIYPKQSKSCILNNLDSPFLKSKSETNGQDRLRTPIG